MNKLKHIIKQEIRKQLNEIRVNNPNSKIFQVEDEGDNMLLIDYDGIEYKDIQRRGHLDGKFIYIEFDEEGTNRYEDDEEDNNEVLEGEKDEKNDLIKLLKSKAIPFEEVKKYNFTYIKIPKRYFDLE